MLFRLSSKLVDLKFVLVVAVQAVEVEIVEVDIGA